MASHDTEMMSYEHSCEKYPPAPLRKGISYRCAK